MVAAYEAALSASVVEGLTLDEVIGVAKEPGLPKPSLLQIEREMCFSRSGAWNANEHASITVDKFTIRPIGRITSRVRHLVVLPYFQVSAWANGHADQEVDFYSEGGFRMSVTSVGVSGPGT